MIQGCDVIGFGAAVIDEVIYLERFPRPDTKARVQRSVRRCGGLSAMALMAAARLGARASYAGLLGFDEDSDWVEDHLNRVDVSTHAVERRDGLGPGNAWVLVDLEGRTRTILSDSKRLHVPVSDWPGEDLIRSARVVLVDHTRVGAMLRITRLARAAGIPVVADLERPSGSEFDAVLEEADHLVISRHLAANLTGSEDPAAALTQLWHPRRQAVVVTAGDEGCWYRDRNGLASSARAPAFRVRARDTTGCGDVFHGAYAVALLDGKPIEDRVRFACAAASFKAAAEIGEDGLASLEEVEIRARGA